MPLGCTFRRPCPPAAAEILKVCRGGRPPNPTPGAPSAGCWRRPPFLHTQTTDGGHSWTPATSEPFGLLLLDIAAYGNNVAVVGALSMEVCHADSALRKRRSPLSEAPAPDLVAVF